MAQSTQTQTHSPDHDDLNRALTIPSLTLFGLAYLAPMMVLGTYGVLATKTHGSAPTAYLLALLALTFTASSYGRSRSPLTYLVIPVIGVEIDAYLLTRLDPTAIKIGLTWLAIGIVYLLVLTRFFRRPPPELSAEGR